MMALKAWPQPPDMSSMRTWIVLSLEERVAVRDSGVICASAAAWVAAVSVGAAIGVDFRKGEVVERRRVRCEMDVWPGRIGRGGFEMALRRGVRARRRVMKSSSDKSRAG